MAACSHLRRIRTGQAMSSGEGAASAVQERKGASRLKALSIGSGLGFGVIGVVVVAADAYLHLGAPGLVRAEILKTLAQRYHRTARLDRVTLDPLRLRAELDGFSLPDRDRRPMIAFQQLSATLSWTSL